MLKVPPDILRNFDEEMGITYFNTFQDNSFSNSAGVFHANQCNSDPLDKYVEAVGKNEKLHEENKTLYKRLPEAEKERDNLLQKLFDESKG